MVSIGDVCRPLGRAGWCVPGPAGEPQSGTQTGQRAGGPRSGPPLIDVQISYFWILVMRSGSLDWVSGVALAQVCSMLVR